MKKLGILFTSRNNYELLQNWMDNVDNEGFEILNIDEDSAEEQKKLGKQICKKYNIGYMDREERGMQNNIVSACNYFKFNNMEWIIWFQHDCFPVTDKFFEMFNDIILTGNLNKFGAVGVNVFHKQPVIEGEFGVTARSPLEPGDLWYRRKEYWPETKVDYSKGFDKPFAVESVAWFLAAVNIDSYIKNIEPTDDYHFFHAWDDICFQFLKKNIYNICIPNISAKHIQKQKEKFGIPTCSPKAGDKREYFYGKWGHHKVWKKRWGFDYENRDSFDGVKERYKDTLLWDFYNHDPADGPLMSFNLWGE